MIYKALHVQIDDNEDKNETNEKNEQQPTETDEEGVCMLKTWDHLISIRIRNGIFFPISAVHASFVVTVEPKHPNKLIPFSIINFVAAEKCEQISVFVSPVEWAVSEEWMVFVWVTHGREKNNNTEHPKKTAEH